jgi:hypothetical protein
MIGVFVNTDIVLKIFLRDSNIFVLLQRDMIN